MIPTNITKPYDLAIIFGIFAIIIVTVGFGIESIETNQAVSVDNTFFSRVELSVNGTLKETSDDVTGGITGQEGAGTTISEDSIVTQGFNSVLNLGKVYGSVMDTLSSGTTILGIDPVYLLIYTSILLICFAVVMYTWIRGR